MQYSAFMVKIKANITTAATMLIAVQARSRFLFASLSSSEAFKSNL